jgi:hypothetical protein
MVELDLVLQNLIGILKNVFTVEAAEVEPVRDFMGRLHLIENGLVATVLKVAMAELVEVVPVVTMPPLVILKPANT